MVVTDDKYWNGDLGVSLKRVVSGSYPGLPQYEPYFDVNYVPFKAMTELFRKASTVVFVAPLDEPGELNEYVKSYWDRVSESKDLSGKNYFALKDLWAKPQQVIFVFADSSADLIEYLESDPQALIRAIQRTENAKALRNTLAAGASPDLTAKLKGNLGVGLDIPRTFREVMVEDNLAWFRQDIEGAIENLLIQTVPISSIGAFDKSVPVELRDGLGRLVSSQNDNTRMVTDTLSGVIQKRIKIDGKDAIESRGLWKMEGDFMGGPFINYCIRDEANKRYVMLDMFVYAPQFDKRRYIRRMEVFLPTVKL